MNQSDSPAISVIIPCYNAHAHLGRTLASLRAQTFRDFETIIVDDGSTDPATIAFLNALDDVRLVRQENRGLAGARNRGFAEARAPLVLPLDSDDWIAPEFLAAALERMRAAPPRSFVFPDLTLEGEAAGVLDKPFNLFEQLYFNQLPYCMLIEKSAWEEIGGYDESMRQGYEDWEFNIRLGLNGYTGIALERPLFHYRVSSTGMLASISRGRHIALWRYIREKHASAYRGRNLLARWWAWRGRASVRPLFLYLLWELCFRLLPDSALNTLFRRLRALSHSAREQRRVRMEAGLDATPGWAATLRRQATVPIVVLPALFSRLTAYLILLIAARILLPEDFGFFAVMTIVGGLVNALVSGGGDMWLNRFSTSRQVAAGRPPLVWAIYLAISATLACLCLALATLAGTVIPALADHASALVLGVLVFSLSGLGEAILALMRSSGRTLAFFTIRDLAAPAALLLLALLLRPASVEGLFLIYLAVWGTLLAGLGLFVATRTGWRPTADAFRMSFLAAAVRHTGMLVLTNLGSRAANYIDVLALTFFLALSRIGEYRVAAQFAIGFLVVQHFVFLNLPYQLRSVGDARVREQTQARLRDYQFALVSLSFVTLVVLIAGMEWLLSLFGPRFVEAADIARALFVLRFLQLLWGPQHEILVSNGLARYDALANLLGVILWFVAFIPINLFAAPVVAAIAATGLAIHVTDAVRALVLYQRAVYCPRLLPLPGRATSRTARG